MSTHPGPGVSPWLAASPVARVRRCACGGVDVCLGRVLVHLSEEELGELADTLDVAAQRLLGDDDGLDATMLVPVRGALA